MTWISRRGLWAWHNQAWPKAGQSHHRWSGKKLQTGLLAQMIKQAAHRGEWRGWRPSASWNGHLWVSRADRVLWENLPRAWIQDGHRTHWTHFTDGGHWGSEGPHAFPHSTEQEMEGPAQGFTTHILCPRDLGIQLFLQGHSLPQWSSDCPCERLYKVVAKRL